MPSMIELDNTEWALVEDLFGPKGRRVKPRPVPATADGGRHPVPRAHGLPMALPA